MADVNRGSRPLSPHLQIYRPQLTSISSILVRISGNALVLAGLMITWWFVAAAAGPEAFATADAVLTSWFGKLVFLGSILAIWYHLLGGLRHLVWDAGHFLDVETSEKMAVGMMIGSVILTLFTIIVL